MVGVQENLNSRRTVYRFTKQEVDVSDLEIAFAAASNAPCHKQTHPWNYYVLGKRSREMLLPSVISLARKKAAQLSDEEIITSEKRAVSKILDIPVIIAVTSKLSPNDSFREEEDYVVMVSSNSDSGNHFTALSIPRGCIRGTEVLKKGQTVGNSTLERW